MSKTVAFVIEEAQYIAAKKAGDTLSEPERARAELVVKLWETEVKPLLGQGIDAANSGSRFRIRVFIDGTYMVQSRRGGKTKQPADKIPVPERKDIYRRDHLCFVLVSLGEYIQDLKADAETDPEAAEVRRAMGVVCPWLTERIVETQNRSKRGLPPRSPRPLE